MKEYSLDSHSGQIGPSGHRREAMNSSATSGLEKYLMASIKVFGVKEGDANKIRALYLDKSKLKQVVFNLLLNSIKYAESDPNIFAIRIEADEMKNQYIIRFKDWGMGVSKGLEERIFEVGFRAPEAIEKNVYGSGLGLTIARSIMREMGGDLILANNYKPTEFQIILPKDLKENPDDTLR